MKCPSCNNTAISFFDWAKGFQWYKTECKSCGQKLKAAPITLFLSVLALILGIAVLLILNYAFQILSPFSFILGLILCFITIAIVGMISYYKTSGYKVAE